MHLKIWEAVANDIMLDIVPWEVWRSSCMHIWLDILYQLFQLLSFVLPYSTLHSIILLILYTLHANFAAE